MGVDEWKELSHKVKSISDDNVTVYDACWIKSSPVSIYLPEYLSVCPHIYLSIFNPHLSIFNPHLSIFNPHLSI